MQEDIVEKWSHDLLDSRDGYLYLRFSGSVDCLYTRHLLCSIGSASVIEFDIITQYCRNMTELYFILTIAW